MLYVVKFTVIYFCIVLYLCYCLVFLFFVLRLCNYNYSAEINHYTIQYQSIINQLVHPQPPIPINGLSNEECNEANVQFDVQYTNKQ